MENPDDLDRDKMDESKKAAFESPLKSLHELKEDFNKIYEGIILRYADLEENGPLIQELTKDDMVTAYKRMMGDLLEIYSTGNVRLNITISDLIKNKEILQELLMSANNLAEERDRLQVGVWSLVVMEKETRKTLDERELLLKLREILISQVVHDLKHPVQVIMGYIDMSDDVNMVELTKQFPEVEPELLEKIVKAVMKDTKDYLLNAKAASYKLKDMAEDIIDVSKIRIGEVQRKLEKDINLSELIFNLVDERSVIFTVRNINLNFNVSDNFPEKVETDPKKIERILLNLIANAEKFTPGNGTISVCLGYNQEEDKIILTISDTGEGMTPKTKESLFEPFKPGEGNKKSETGIGLSTVKTFVDLLEGKIEVETELKKGSTFKVFLPTSYGPEAAENPIEA